MSLERIVQIHIAALAVIGATLLGMGQDNVALPMLAVFAAITSVIFTDTLNWFPLNRFVANMLALLALFFSLGDFFQADTRNQLLAIANLLVYLQVVLFYQRKSDRLYWQLAVLSLLEVVVSAALNVSMEFGVVLILYAAVAFSTLSFFFVQREVERFARASKAGSGSQTRTRAKSVSGTSSAKRRLLTHRPAIHLPFDAEALGQQVIGWGLLRQTTAIGLTTLVFALVLFFWVPRLDNSFGRGATMRVTRVIGFSSEVALDEMGEVLESTEPVMRVSFRDHGTKTPYRFYGDPYFPGVVLGKYGLHSGVSRWKPLSLPSDHAGRSTVQGRRLRPPPRSRHLVREDIILEPIDELTLFGISPAYRIDQTPGDIRIDLLNRQVYRDTQYSGRPRREYRYSLVTTGIIGGLQVDVTPQPARPSLGTSLEWLEWEKQQLLEFNRSRFPELTAIANEIADKQRALSPSRAKIAKALRDHFLVPDRYVYTLDFSEVPVDRGRDPIEHFVADHRMGHCEYFASALVMMLRSQGIPARVVVGFRGGEYNALGDFYQILQCHTHAWVEAYLEPEDAAREVPPGADVSPAGGWLRLDPTPGSDIDKAKQLERGPMDVVDDVLDYARLLWSDYILGLTAKRQRESIYKPVTENATPETWTAYVEQLERDRDKTIRFLKEASLIWQAPLAVLLIAATLVGLRLARGKTKRRGTSRVATVVRSWRSRLMGKPEGLGPETQPRHVEFYQRFESLLRELGFTRVPSQTQREFAVRAVEYLTNLALEPDVAQVPKKIADAFYRVRFGNVDLPAVETETVDLALHGLERAIASWKTKSRDSRRSRD